MSWACNVGKEQLGSLSEQDGTDACTRCTCYRLEANVMEK